MLVLKEEVPHSLQFDPESGALVRQPALPFDAVMRLASRTPCPAAPDGRPCGEQISVSTSRFTAPGAEPSDEVALTGGWRCRAGHGPRQLAKPRETEPIG